MVKFNVSKCKQQSPSESTSRSANEETPWFIVFTEARRRSYADKAYTDSKQHLELFLTEMMRLVQCIFNCRFLFCLSPRIMCLSGDGLSDFWVFINPSL